MGRKRREEETLRIEIARSKDLREGILRNLLMEEMTSSKLTLILASRKLISNLLLRMWRRRATDTTEMKKMVSLQIYHTSENMVQVFLYSSNSNGL